MPPKEVLENMDLSISEVYQAFVWKGENAELAKDLYDTPVETIGGVTDRATRLIAAYKTAAWHSAERIETIARTLTHVCGEIGCYTPRVRESIERLGAGVVEASHQSVVMGGPVYILNKAATARRVATLAHERGLDLSPVFFIADYDMVQAELTNIRTPVPGQDGNLVSVPVPEGYEHSPVSRLPLPGYDWYSRTEDSIRAGYRPLFKSMGALHRSMFDERLEQCLALTRSTYVNSRTLGDWAMKILARLFNIEQDLGIPLVPASDLSVRELLVTGMELLLSRTARTRFIKAHNAASEAARKGGFKPGMSPRDSRYVPFYYECTNATCHSSRTELQYEDQGSKATITGKCPSCGEDIEIETSADKPDLKEFAANLSPRVDSRQIIVDTMLPVLIHIGGIGETAYYAQVIPAARALSVPFPLFVRYPRVYFNTPWNEQLALSLKRNNIPVLHSPGLFALVGKIGRSAKKGKPEELNDAVWELMRLITDTRRALDQELARIKEAVPKAAGEEAKRLLTLKLDLERYLSWVFGEYAEEKAGQETAWSWIEWAVNSSFHDLFGPYERAYTGAMKNGATMFVNFTVPEEPSN